MHDADKLMTVRVIQRTFLLLMAMVASACMTVRLVSDYDPQTDQELAKLYTENTQFVDRMIGLKGQEAGTYEPNKQYYDGAIARVEVLIARSKGYSVLGGCPSISAISSAAGAALSPEARAQLGAPPEGDCQTVVLELLKGAYQDMRTFHQEQGSRGIPGSARDQFIEGGVGSLLRTAIVVQSAKKAAQQAGER